MSTVFTKPDTDCRCHLAHDRISSDRRPSDTTRNPVSTAAIEWHIKLVDECLAGGWPVFPDLNDPALCIDFLCQKFAQVEKVGPVIRRAKDRGLVYCVIRRKSCVRISDIARMFHDGPDNLPEELRR